ncbi:MAG: ABC transporter permease [Planctomyces sp.]
MGHAFFLAWKSLRWHRGRSIILVCSLALTLWFPITIRLLLNQFRDEIASRSDQTPLIVGALGSRIDLVLHGLYFDKPPSQLITMAEADYVHEAGFGTAIPIDATFRIQGTRQTTGAPIVGTVPEYFEFRRLSVRAGTMFSMPGECVVGAALAAKMKLSPGDAVLSAPRNAFNLAGDYPIRMHVTGILQPSASADDDVVFTDLQTVWIIRGIGHGHQDLSAADDPGLILNRNQTEIVGSAAVLPFTEITRENRDSFHFHGDPSEFPVSAVIVLPDSQKSHTMLLGRYASDRQTVQCVSAAVVIQELLEIVFRAEQLLRISTWTAGLVTALMGGLVISLSMRLRASEMQTMEHLGCGKWMVFRLLAAEIIMLLSAGVCLAAAGGFVTHRMMSHFLRMLIF